MEEEVGIKVTRLRRRLSVEADDVKSPSTQSTPTKKRGGRLAAKPQLELIDENAPETVPKRTRKSTAREIAEPVDEKAVTPSRRSTRIRSNTSIVSETPDVAEEKGTPSRRSTRIKSNTSIIAETVPNVNSPRAKRAARRVSQVGSDNETPVTPARQTRRTRKDSTSSVDKQADSNAGKLGSQVTEVIAEESENNVKETKNTDSPKNDSPTLRKSPRLVGKSGRKSSSLDNENKENENQIEKESSETTTDVNKSVSETKSEIINDDQKTTEQNNLSVASSNLIKELDEAPTKGKISMNKSATAVKEPEVKSRRNRTKSWTTISIEPSHENNFFSDSEATKKKNKKNNSSINLSNISGSGDGIMNESNHNDEEKKKHYNINVSLNSSVSSEKKKKKGEKTISVETSIHEVSVLNSSLKSNTSAVKLPELKEISEDVNKEVDNLNTSKKYNASETEKLFEQAPSSLIQTLVYIEDSDSNHDIAEKQNIRKNFDSGDQCVPVVHHHLTKDETSKEQQNNLSYEPMDIDETMPENISLSTFTNKNNSVSLENQEPELTKSKSIANSPQIQNKSTNKSKKMSISNVIQNADKDQESNSLQKQSSQADTKDNDSMSKVLNKSKRKSSISHVATEDTTDGMISMVNGNSATIDTDNESKKANKTKRKSSILNSVTEDKDCNKSQEAFSSNTVNDETISKATNKSKRKSSLCKVTPDNDTDNSDKSKIKSLTSESVCEETNKSLNKSKRKSAVTTMVAEVSTNKINSSIPNTENDESMNKSSNKSKNKSLISPTVSQTLDKIDQSNKSTLVLSQIKDVSEGEINVELNNEQLSKSVTVPSMNPETDLDKKNRSLTYSTSTPLQQKPIKKLGMQINSSIITPSSVSKMDKKKTLNGSKKETSTMSQKIDSETSEEEDSEKEESSEKSKVIDDEAEEASEAYESGDSRDEDEREYEEQHEIVEKGETLESEDENEYPDSSDYEKDSFIVSSDEEDNDLLSGSGDDLSMSADELSMSAKSKKKYDERKTKEQKKASREMYAARHKLNESDKSAKSKSPKSKKNNRQRFDTSSSESEEEVTAQSKKIRRQKIDSSQDISTAQSDADKSVFQKKKKVKRLSESVCDDDATKEKEISIHEENKTDKIDPLALQNVVKEEPKTPQKDLNISTVAITNLDEVEEVNVNENISIIKSNQTTDPLEATIAENNDSVSEDAAEDSISENEEITQNYESVLNNLNKSNSKKTKSLNISLNLNKNTKQKAKEPIVDQLNLTQVKQKKKKADTTKDAVEAKKLNKSSHNKILDKVDKPINMFSENSSDSIDMKLLFPEDSNDSEVVAVEVGSEKQQAKENNQNVDVQYTPENFIPLKRTEGKTNLLENKDVVNKSTTNNDESILNVSSKKKNKRKSAQVEEAVTMNTEEGDNINFFIDTTGTLADVNNTDANISIKNSTKKNKQKNNVSYVNVEEATVDDDSNEAPLEVSYRSEKNKFKQDLNTTQNKDETKTGNAAIETPGQSAKKKKNNKKGLNSSQNVTEIGVIENTEEAVENMNATANNEESSAKKKKKKKMSESFKETDHAASAELIQNASVGSAKKQKQKSISESSAVDQESVNQDDKDVTNEEITKKRKRKSSANQTIEEIDLKDEVKLVVSKSVESTNNQKKKRKISDDGKDVQDHVDWVTTKEEKAAFTYSKKKNKVSQRQEVDESGDEITKKNKKRKERDDDDACKISKILKQNSFDKVHVPRLPATILNQLNDKPKNDINEIKKPKVISTTSFVVEEARKRKNKPSNYLEESVYLNDNLEEKRQKGSIKNPKVLPFIPTASTSDNGFTTNFRVNIIPHQTKFVAQSSDISNFKNDYLHKKRIKKLGTFEMYKRQRNIKISKF